MRGLIDLTNGAREESIVSVMNRVRARAASYVIIRSFYNIIAVESRRGINNIEHEPIVRLAVERGRERARRARLIYYFSWSTRAEDS